MRQILFFALICFCFEYIYSKQEEEQQRYELNLEDGKLRNRVKLLWDHSREAFLKSKLNKRYKEKYIDNRGRMPEKLDTEEYAARSEQFYQNMSENFGRVSSQVVNDYKECLLCRIERGFGEATKCLELMCTLRDWNATNFVQSVAYVEQKQLEVRNEYGVLNYNFLLEDYNESLELLEMDLKQSNGLPSDSVFRVMSLAQMIYGNRTEVETGLTYLYTPPSFGILAMKQNLTA